MNQSIYNTILNFITEKGLSVMIVMVLLFLGYQYAQLQLELMQYERQDLLRQKGYSLQGFTTIDSSGSVLTIKFDLILLKEKE